jgi:hypothetical protein
MTDDSSEKLKSTVDGYIQRVGGLLLQLRTAIDEDDLTSMKETTEALESELAALKPALN